MWIILFARPFQASIFKRSAKIILQRLIPFPAGRCGDLLNEGEELRYFPRIDFANVSRTAEKRLLELLKVDSLDPVPEWFENLCTMKHGPNRLLLSGYDLERKSGVQPGLDFADREKELFAHREMGADALRALELCRKASDAVRTRLSQEIPLLSAALKWGRKAAKAA